MIINIAQLRAANTERRTLNATILPPKHDAACSTKVEHDAQPIKSVEDIRRICDYLLELERYRDYMLFVLGINFGLRIGDLLSLRFGDLLNEDCTFKESFRILEQKTDTTRKRTCNRYVAINNAVMDAVELYLSHTEGVSLSDFLFRSQSNRGKNVDAPLDRKSAYRILQGIANDLHINARMSTHCLRKTFGYHQMMMGGNDQRTLLLLQKIFGHSSSMQTLTYIGITEEEMTDAYRRLNLGSVDYTAARLGRVTA